jgi:hypothetical protein
MLRLEFYVRATCAVGTGHNVATTAYDGSLIYRRGTATLRGPVRCRDGDLMPIWSTGFPRNLEAAGKPEPSSGRSSAVGSLRRSWMMSS